MLSVVIPTLNSSKVLRATLDAIALGRDRLPCEMIVVDGGSGDDTKFVAAACGATCVEATQGRGYQLATGAATAAGDWLLFLHADTVPDGDWVAVVQAFMNNAGNQRRAGFFRFRLDDQGFAARIIERAVEWRSVSLGLPYGDQGLLISRAFYEMLDGYKPIPLMEDVEFARRIGRRRLHVLDATAVTSAERYRRDGFLLRPLRNLVCLGLYAIGVSPRMISDLYR